MHSVDRQITLEKRKLRQQMLARRAPVSMRSMSHAGESVARHFSDHPILAFVDSFAGYMPMRSELDVLPIFRTMARYEKTTAMPRIMENKTLQFRCWREGDPLQRHPSLQVEEPLATAPSIIPELVLVPLVAFDGEGYRLGYGGGYYDRTMQTMRQFSTPPLFIGVAYSAQEVEHIPTEAHDQKLDGILTELGVSMFG